MSTPSPEYFPAGDPFGDHDLVLAADQMEMIITTLEPRARHMNRQWTDLFGPHPSSIDGCWFYIKQTDDDEFSIVMEDFKPQHAFRLDRRMEELRGLVADSESISCATGLRDGDFGAAIVGDAAALREIPSVHVRIERRP